MMDFFVHSSALCESKNIGERTRVWAFAHILSGAVVGTDCNVCDGVFIESDVVVGSRTTIKCGVQLWNGVRLGNDVFVGPNATFTNDHFPRSGDHSQPLLQTTVDDGASIGANATILPGISIGKGAMIGAGSVVTRSVPPNAIVVGNPARIVGYATDSATAPNPETRSVTPEVLPTQVPGVRLFKLPEFVDIRGSLTVGDFENFLPFKAKRFFLVHNVPSQETRGEHAHRICHQFLICVSGSVRVLADDGIRRADLLLDSKNLGLHLPPMIWGTQYRYSSDAVLLVFASEAYDSDEYVRDYAEFTRLTSNA